MASSDPHQGGDLFDMAKDGTSIPNDAGKQNLIPSVPRPDQIEDPNDLGAAGMEAAADNATDIPRVCTYSPSLSNSKMSTCNWYIVVQFCCLNAMVTTANNASVRI